MLCECNLKVTQKRTVVAVDGAHGGLLLIVPPIVWFFRLLIFGTELSLRSSFASWNGERIGFGLKLK